MAHLLYFGVIFTLVLNGYEVKGTLSPSRVTQFAKPLDFQGDIKKSTISSHNKTVVCVLDSWSHWRTKESSFNIEDIDASLCTQLYYRNAGIDNKTYEISVRDTHLAEGMQWLKKIAGLSKDNPHLKVFLTIGGWNEGSWRFTKMAGDYKLRAAFIDSVLRILEKYGFHGLDLAWEYPAWEKRGGSPSDRENLPILLQELKEAFSSKYTLALTASGDRYVAGAAYKIKLISGFVDQINLRSMDYYGSWNGKAYHQAALNDESVKESVMATVNFFLEMGAPADKLVVGIPLYGRTFLLKETPAPEENGLEKKSQGGFAGRWVPDESLIGYHEICYNLTNHKSEWSTYWDNYALASFARNGRKWVSFDDAESIQMKVEFMLNKTLKGVMAWTIDTDDFKGTACRKEYANDEDLVKFPLLRTINYEIAKRSQIEEASPSSRAGPDKPGSNQEDHGKLDKNTNDKQMSKSSTSSNAYVLWLILNLLIVTLVM